MAKKKVFFENALIPAQKEGGFARGLAGFLFKLDLVSAWGLVFFIRDIEAGSAALFLSGLLLASVVLALAFSWLFFFAAAGFAVLLLQRAFFALKVRAIREDFGENGIF